MADELLGLSSMATRELLVELSAAVLRRCALPVRFEAAGGLEVVRSIRAGATADLAVLSRQQMAELDADGLLQSGTLRPLFVSDVVAAVPAVSGPLPLRTEDDVRAALDGADRIAYSTGPSGDAVLDLVDRWQLGEVVRPKLVQAEPGTPVASLLAEGEADLGFQQRSEVAGVAGVRVLGPLPATAAIRSTFSGAVLASSVHRRHAGDVLAFLTSKYAEHHVAATGMTIAR